MFFITGSAGKFAEFKTFFPDLKQLDIDLPEIQSMDPQVIITAKLKAARQQTSEDILVEDTGLYFNCLNGLPGPLIKWFSNQLGYDGLAALALKYDSQTAQAVTWIGYSSAEGGNHFFKGELTGIIVMPRGEGFGWDIIFQPAGHTRTFGEMSSEEKNTMSMRKNAILQLQKFLTENSSNLS